MVVPRWNFVTLTQKRPPVFALMWVRLPTTSASAYDEAREGRKRYFRFAAEYTRNAEQFANAGIRDHILALNTFVGRGAQGLS